MWLEAFYAAPSLFFTAVMRHHLLRENYLKCKQRKRILNENNMVKKSNWQESDQSGLPRTNPASGRVQRLNRRPPDFENTALNYSATLPPYFWPTLVSVIFFSKMFIHSYIILLEMMCPTCTIS